MPDRPLRGATVSAAVIGLHGRAVERWSPDTRRRFGLVVGIIAAAVVTATSLALSGATLPRIDLIPYLGLAAACWVGAGGVLVPVPGVRPLSWVMVVHQSVALDPLLVAGLSALAMALGQTSLFIAAEHGARHHRTHKERKHRHELTHADRPQESVAIDGSEEPAVPVGRVKRARIRVAATSQRAADRLKGHPMRGVLLASSIPSPLTSAASSAAGAAGMPFSRFFLSSLAGFLIFVVLLVVFGAGLLALLGIAAD